MIGQTRQIPPRGHRPDDRRVELELARSDGYSFRSASVGSTRSARRAGTMQASMQTRIMTAGLTVIGGLAMAFAIWVGIGTFEFITQVVYPTIPFEAGDRIVAIELWNTDT